MVDCHFIVVVVLSLSSWYRYRHGIVVIVVIVVVVSWCRRRRCRVDIQTHFCGHPSTPMNQLDTTQAEFQARRAEKPIDCCVEVKKNNLKDTQHKKLNFEAKT